MELLRYWKVIQKSLWLVLLIVAIGVGATTYFTLKQPAQYESSATLLLNPSMPSAYLPYVQSQAATNLADSYTELMRTRYFAETVAKSLPFPMSADAVSASISSQLQPNTLFYRISVRMDAPDKAQKLVQTILSVFLNSKAQQQASGNTDTSGSVKTELRQRLRDELTYLDTQVTSYEGEIKRVETQPISKERDDRLVQLRGQLVTLQQTKTQAMSALAQVGDNASEANTAIVLDEPLPGNLIGNRLTTNLVIALLVSLLLGIGLALLRDYLDYTIHSAEDLEQVLGLTPVAAFRVATGFAGSVSSKRGHQVKRINSKNPPKLAGHRLVTLEHPRSPDAENFRVLRTNIQFSSVDKPLRSLVVTSAVPGEGKSFTSSNLAIVLAQAGKRVILVDADLRRPTLHHIFELPNLSGFTNLILNSSTEVEGAIQPVSGVPNLAVVTSGPLPPNPSELLHSAQTVQLMSQLATQADMVIYDAPPAGIVTDPVILGTRADAVVMVINASVTRRDMITRVLANLKKVGVPMVLPVLNRVKTADMQNYGYGRGYQAYYGSDNNDRQGPAPSGRSKKASTNGKVPIPAEQSGPSPVHVEQNGFSPADVTTVR